MISPAGVTNIAEIAGLKRLWAETVGDPRICIAVLDGAVDRTHPSLALANLTSLDTLVPCCADQERAMKHGTHVASVLFGQHGGSISGIAPRCRGLIVPIFKDGPDHSLAPCSQLDLARALSLAVQAGAQIINISGGENSPSGTAHPILADAVRNCVAQGVLVVAAAGNEGCRCLHVPGALPAVLAVGAMDARGEPLAFSNWGERYQFQGILAPGENILGAVPGDGLAAHGGTSYATAIVSGTAALLLSLQLKLGRSPDARAVRAALLRSAVGCDDLPATDCRRLLAGRLDIEGAMSRIIGGGTVMADSTGTSQIVSAHAAAVADSEVPVALSARSGVRAAAYQNEGSQTPEAPQSLPVESAVARGASESPKEKDGVLPSHACAPGCSCGSREGCTCGSATSPSLVYALGQLDFSFGTEARRDSIAQHMDGNPDDPNLLLNYLAENPWDAEAITWTLNLDATPIYAIRPQGVFASEGYQRLRQFLTEQLTEGVERISAPGVIAGKARLMSGQVVPIVRPDLRCMYSWKTAALVEAVAGTAPSDSAGDEEKQEYVRRRRGVTNFLERIYHGLRNLGLTPQERAINYAATNALNAHQVFEDALNAKMELDTIEVERSPICRPDSDCWDVKLLFFDPENVLRGRKAYRFTIDVSDTCPVTVGEVRSWSMR